MAANANASKEACRIGSTITISGSLVGDQDVILEGRVEGQIGLQSRLVVEEAGRVEAHVEATEVEVKGAVNGDIQAVKVITLHPSARVSGNLRAGKVVLFEGAHFSGSIEMDVDLPDELDDGAHA